MSCQKMSSAADYYDRVVIGAGIMGACAAYQLTKAGHRRVLLIDQFPLPHARGSSHGRSRAIHSGYREMAMVELAQRTRRLWSEIETQTGETLCTDCHMVMVAPSSNQTAMDSFRECLQQGQLVSAAELQQLLPAAVFPDGTLAAVDTTAGLLHADRCLRAVTRLFRDAGGSISHDWPVTAVTSVASGRLVVVTGPHGQQLTTGGAVVCAGAWAGRLVAPLRPLLTPARVAVTYWRLRPGVTLPLSGIDLGTTQQNHGRFYWLPSSEYPGMVKLCMHYGVPCDPDQRDVIPVDDIIAKTQEYVARFFPGLESEPAVVEDCMYTLSSDGRPIIDVHPDINNIVFAAGMSGEGFKMGPVYGEILQRLVDGLPCDVDLAPFSLQRFNKPERLTSSL